MQEGRSRLPCRRDEICVCASQAKDLPSSSALESALLRQDRAELAAALLLWATAAAFIHPPASVPTRTVASAAEGYAGYSPEELRDMNRTQMVDMLKDTRATRPEYVEGMAAWNRANHNGKHPLQPKVTPDLFVCR